MADTLRAATELSVHDLQDYAHWDEAVRHVSQRPDADWIADNIIAYLGGAQGYRHVFALDGHDRPAFVHEAGVRTPGDPYRILGSDFAVAAARVRAMPRTGEAITGGFARSGGGIVVFAVAQIVPLTPKVQIGPGPTHLLAIAKPLDAAMLARLGRDGRLDALKLSSARPAGVPTLAVRGPDGRTIAWLSWNGTRPGLDLMRTAMPWFVLAALFTIAAAIALVRRRAQLMTELHASQAHALAIALQDAVTGLPNRRALAQEIESALGGTGQVTLLYMDLDGFKDANDLYGHATGDALLRDAARRIEVAVPGAFVARAGGDEFAVVIKNADFNAMEAAASAILSGFAEPFSTAGFQAALGISIGAVERRCCAGEAADDLLRHADTAMYVAKSEGKHCWRRYEPAMEEIYRLRVRMERDLMTAIEAGEIHLAFQPVVDASTCRIRAVEALARWTHPTHGEVPPDIFIPLAERAGMIAALGRHVLRAACIETRALGVDLAVNLSPAQFWDRNLVDDIRSTLAETGFPAARLELEITERYLLDRPDAAASILDQLRALGIRTALDDFGAGYASIGYLRQLKFDRLKIDRQFIEPLGSDPQACDLLAAIVALARSLNLEITAEGIENEAQAGLARAAGCTKLQGFLFGRPVAIADLLLVERPGISCGLEFAGQAA